MVAGDKRATVLVNLGDYDDSGVDIMRDLHNWIEELSGKAVQTLRVAVLPEHVTDGEQQHHDRQSGFECGGYLGRSAAKVDLLAVANPLHVIANHSASGLMPRRS
jgi:hypothetical protein